MINKADAADPLVLARLRAARAALGRGLAPRTGEGIAEALRARRGRAAAARRRVHGAAALRARRPDQPAPPAGRDRLDGAHRPTAPSSPAAPTPTWPASWRRTPSSRSPAGASRVLSPAPDPRRAMRVEVTSGVRTLCAVRYSGGVAGRAALVGSASTSRAAGDPARSAPAYPGASGSPLTPRRGPGRSPAPASRVVVIGDSWSAGLGLDRPARLLAVAARRPRPRRRVLRLRVRRARQRLRRGSPSPTGRRTRCVGAPTWSWSRADSTTATSPTPRSAPASPGWCASLARPTAVVVVGPASAPARAAGSRTSTPSWPSSPAVRRRLRLAPSTSTWPTSATGCTSPSAGHRAFGDYVDSRLSGLAQPS